MLTYWIEEGNPADSSRLLPMIKRIKEYDDGERVDRQEAQTLPCWSRRQYLDA